MKIKSYKKLKNNSYKISFEDSTNDLVLYDDIILKYNLLLKKEISNSELEKIKKENESFSCYYKAIQYLTYKNRSKKEIEEYLKKQGFSLKDIESTIKILEERKIINEDTYLKMFIHDQILLTNNGPKKIEKKLLDLGFSEENIEKELSTITKDVWQEKLKHAIVKKVNSNKKDGIHKIKEKIIYHFINEGYSKEEIISILDTIEFPKNESALTKEALKLYKKLSIKYKDNELKYQIKGRLLNKGFSYEEIDTVIEDIKKSS